MRTSLTRCHAHACVWPRISTTRAEVRNSVAGPATLPVVVTGTMAWQVSDTDDPMLRRHDGQRAFAAQGRERVEALEHFLLTLSFVRGVVYQRGAKCCEVDDVRAGRDRLGLPPPGGSLRLGRSAC